MRWLMGESSASQSLLFSGESGGGGFLQGGLLAGLADGAVGEVVAAANDFAAGNGDEFDGFGFARLESNGGAGGDVESFAIGLGAIEFQRGVRLDEMIMAADLHGTVA